MNSKKQTISFIREYLDNLFARKHIINQADIMTGTRVLDLALGAVGSVWAVWCLGPTNFGISGADQRIEIGQLFHAKLRSSLLRRKHESKEEFAV